MQCFKGETSGIIRILINVSNSEMWQSIMSLVLSNVHIG